jgi:hypothetical protein
MAGRTTQVLLLLVMSGCELLVDAPRMREREDSGERCSDGTDNDENGAVDCEEPACSGKGGCPIVMHVDWAEVAGGKEHDAPLALATDRQGNILVTGFFQGRFEWGTSAVDAPQAVDAFVAKLAPTGQLLWLRRLGSVEAMGKAITADADGNVYVVGYTRSEGLRPPAPPYHALDAFAAKFTAAGERVWLRLFGGEGLDEGNAVAVDGKGKGTVYVAGSYQETMDPGECTTLAKGPRDAFLIELSPSGEPVRATCFGGDYEDVIAGLALDMDGSVIVTGEASDQIDFGDGPKRTHGPPDMFVARFHAGGTLAWARIAGDSDEDGGRQVAVDSRDGSVVVMGAFRGVLDLGLLDRALLSSCYDHACPGAKDGFVAKYNRDGEGLWAARFSARDGIMPTSLALDPRGLVLLSGSFVTTLSFAMPATPADQGNTPSAVPILETQEGAADLFVAEFHPESGQILGATAFGGMYEDGGDLDLDGAAVIAVGTQGALFLTGSFTDSIRISAQETLRARVMCMAGDWCPSDVVLMSLSP